MASGEVVARGELVARGEAVANGEGKPTPVYFVGWGLGPSARRPRPSRAKAARGKLGIGLPVCNAH